MIYACDCFQRGKGSIHVCCFCFALILFCFCFDLFLFYFCFTFDFSLLLFDKDTGTSWAFARSSKAPCNVICENYKTDFQNHLCTGTRQNPWLGQNLCRHPVLYESRNISKRAVRYHSVSHKTVHCINDLPNHLRSYGHEDHARTACRAARDTVPASGAFL